MLTISDPLSAGHVCQYFKSEYANAEDNYYAASAEIPGRWAGRLAAEFGLSGVVTEQAFARLANGQHPGTGEQLIRITQPFSYDNAKGETVTTMDHRAGWDLVFSAPKTTSLVALVGGDERVRDAHRESVDAALREVEAYTQARLGNTRLPVTTGAFVAAVFEHDSARPVNGYSAPQLHAHCVIANVAKLSQLQHAQLIADGVIPQRSKEWRSIQSHELLRSQAFATAAYRTELARRLTALGYHIERGAHGQPEIAGFTKEYLDAASPRRKQIQDLLAQQGRSGAAAAQIAAHQSRASKVTLAKEDVQRQHQEMALAHGNQPQKAVRAATMSGRGHTLQPTDIRHAHDAVAYAKDRNMERAAVVDGRAVLTDALRRGMGRVTADSVRTEFMRRVDMGEFLARSSTPGAATRSWTTPEMVAMEQATIDRMRQWQGQHAAIASLSVQQDALALAPSLKADQRAAVEHVLSSTDQVMALDGYAGTGKTYALKVIRDGAERAGYQVEGVAPTSNAAKELASVGMPTQTLQRYVTRPSPPDQRPRLIMLDESSLAGTQLMKSFLDRAQAAGHRILLVGDVRQHQSVDAGKSYEQLQEAGMRKATLTQIVRQRSPRLKAVAQQLATGDTAKAIADLQDMGKVHEIADRGTRLDALTAAFLTSPEKTLIVCPDNQSRQEINAVIQHALMDARTKAHGIAPTDVLVQRQNMTSTDRLYADRYDLGDTVRYNTSRPEIGLVRGSYAVVTAHNREANTLTVRTSAGKTVTYNARRITGVSVYETQPRALAKGDRIQFTAPSADLGVINRQLGTMRRLYRGTAYVHLDDGRDVVFKVRDHPHLDLAYAVTSHSSQGQTANRVLVHIDTDRASVQIVNQRLAYVALSRGKFDMQIYTNNAAALTRAVSREVSHRAAIEGSRVQQPREQERAVAV